jgi:hypothetical protein
MYNDYGYDKDDNDFSNDSNNNSVQFLFLNMLSQEPGSQ